ncbi:MAG: flagellar protein FlgN [Deltaproteobacteria bacterium]|nr:flagellar protein FlgN [Deltaproteobacteria bacterium]
MKESNQEMDLLFHLLDQEVLNYDQLIKEIKKEAKFLRAGDTESLIRSVKAIDDCIKTIRIIEGEVQRTAETILNGLGKEGRGRALSCLSSLLPPTHQSRLSSYQRTLLQLKDWAGQINDQNKSFIQEFLGYLGDIFSLLVSPAYESPGYLQTGRKRPSTLLPYALNKEV